jgi:hypothetical protein
MRADARNPSGFRARASAHFLANEYEHEHDDGKCVPYIACPVIAPQGRRIPRGCSYVRQNVDAPPSGDGSYVRQNVAITVGYGPTFWRT